MRIVMMTNTYKPIVGGLEKSVESFAAEYRSRGHEVIIVVPAQNGATRDEEGIIRIPALQNFNGTDFSLALPIRLSLSKKLDAFRPDIVHSHHPFLIGDTALRVAAKYKIPLIFTHHTLYEENTHYVPGNARLLKQFVLTLAIGYANLCDYVFAPSESIERLIKERGCTTPVAVVPTGIYPASFAISPGKNPRLRWGISPRSFVVGYVGRIEREKNIRFLSLAVARFLKGKPNAVFFVVGNGKDLKRLKEIFQKEGLRDRLICAGRLEGQELIEAYQAMDVFAFASHSETQGLVLLEAMASGVPVVAVDAPGVREVVRDGKNGRLITKDDETLFADALKWTAIQPADLKARLGDKARATTLKFNMAKSAQKALAIYQRVLEKENLKRPIMDNLWRENIRLIKAEVQLVKAFARAAEAAVSRPHHPRIQKSGPKLLLGNKGGIELSSNKFSKLIKEEFVPLIKKATHDTIQSIVEVENRIKKYADEHRYNPRMNANNDANEREV